VYGTITSQPPDGLTLGVTVPTGAQYGRLGLVTDKGVVATPILFAPIETPHIAALSPLAGQKAGSVITITGSHFSGVDDVSLGATHLTSLRVTETKVTATIPLGTAAATYTLTVHNAAGTDTASYAVAVKPGFDSFDPSHGPANSTKTTNLHISDLQGRLRGVSVVLFNGKPGTNLSVSNDGESLTVDAPVGATTGKITVKNALGVAVSATTFTVDAPPTVTSLSVLTGKEGDPVTIFGTHLATATSVSFGGVEQADVTPAADGTSIATTVPVGAQIGTVLVDAPNGTATSTNVFTPSLVPVIDSVSPANQALKGTSLTLTGHNFTTATAVTIGGADATFQVVSDTQITTSVPSGSAGGSVQIAVTDPGGTGHTSYRVLVPPAITSFPAAAFNGATISVVGDYFDSVSKVEVNGENASFSFVDSQHLSVTIPYDATPGPIAVTNAAGKTTSSTSFDAVRVLSLTFSQSNLGPGDTITVGGTGLSGLTGLLLNGAAGSVAPNAGGTDTQVVFTMPGCGQSGTWFLYVGTFQYNAGTLTYTGPACS
jgi:hypothetical protein